MKALSIWQPWAWAILHAGKRIENRQWTSVPRAMIGQTFLLHASKGVGTRADFDGAVESVCGIAGLAEPTGFAEAFYRSGEDCGGIWVPDPTLPFGALVGRARLIDALATSPGGHRLRTGSRPLVCLLCGAELAGPPPDSACPKADPWAVSSTLGLILADVVAFPEPIPFKGAQGWFVVPGLVVDACDPALAKRYQRYRFLAACPSRTDEEETEVHRLRDELRTTHGRDPGFEARKREDQ